MEKLGSIDRPALLKGGLKFAISGLFGLLIGALLLFAAAILAEAAS